MLNNHDRQLNLFPLSPLIFFFFPSCIVHIHCEQHVVAKLPWLQVLVPEVMQYMHRKIWQWRIKLNRKQEKPLTCWGLHTSYAVFFFFFGVNSNFFFFWGTGTTIRGQGCACSGLNCCFSGNKSGSPPTSAQHKLSLPEWLENLHTRIKLCK